ncbi:hypothetical protein [Hydrogenophaga sp. PAMC20947]|uniref:hypothetical protein n=1 Tax=Hydrogenophaga sp. PAMC20947 TaxID=2565558 RepID=UPI0014477D2E|nr:hypothetical protein [Hydrogenophaga sp. PAMC20947]
MDWISASSSLEWSRNRGKERNGQSVQDSGGMGGFQMLCQKTHAYQEAGYIFSPTTMKQPLERAAMTPRSDESKNSPCDQHLEMGDWDVMFCAVLARLGSAAESMDLNSPQRNCLPECLESLQMLRQSALQHWDHSGRAGSLRDLGVLAPAEPKVQTSDSDGQGEQH